ncbi:autophagy protein 5-like [Teleopsis dalmanni]|uniref:autophagy protein 5-like n=1 Tax=Teleopsis dalmanni TaxID=139649 RepID=UPI0018CF10C7|nr:autophagy protein 5-like [Teleopsis dalmanni]
MTKYDEKVDIFKRKIIRRILGPIREGDGTYWLRFNDECVLFDTLHSDEDDQPWNVTIHFSKCPNDTLVKLSTRDELEAHFMSCLKEADVLKHRGQIISTMQKKDHNQLWLGLTNDKFDQFWAINRRLMEANSEQETFKHVPIRFYEKWI